MSTIHGLQSTAADAEARLPLELSEENLLSLPIPDVLVATTSLTPSWRDFIESSEQMRTSIRGFDWRESNRDLRSGYDTATNMNVREGPCTFRFKVADGTVTLHRRADGVEGLVWDPTSLEQPLRVLDPTSKIAAFNFDSRSTDSRVDTGFIALRDFDGKLVCGKSVTEPFADMELSRYLGVFYARDPGDETVVAAIALKEMEWFRSEYASTQGWFEMLERRATTDRILEAAQVTRNSARKE